MKYFKKVFPMNVKQRKDYEMETYSTIDILRTDKANGTYLVSQNENGPVIVLIDNDFNKIGPVLTGKIIGHG